MLGAVEATLKAGKRTGEVADTILLVKGVGNFAVRQGARYLARRQAGGFAGKAVGEAAAKEAASEAATNGGEAATRVLRSKSSTEVKQAMGAQTSPKKLQRQLGKAGLIDSGKVRIVKATAEEAAQLEQGLGASTQVFGWVSRAGKKLLTDAKGRAIIKVTERALQSVEEAVKTVGHELEHVKQILAGAGESEAAAEAAGHEMFEAFAKFFKRGSKK